MSTYDNQSQKVNSNRAILQISESGVGLETVGKMANARSANFVQAETAASEFSSVNERLGESERERVRL